MNHMKDTKYVAPGITVLDVNVEYGFAASAGGGLEQPGQKPWKFDYMDEEDELLW